MSLTFDQRRAEAARIHDDAESRLAEIAKTKAVFIASVQSMGLNLGLSKSDMECLNGHIEDMESDLFADEKRALRTEIDTASDIANQRFWDYSRKWSESPA